MTVGAFLLILAVLILVALYLYAPFLNGGRNLGFDEHRETSALMAERDRLINSLQELDFDFKLGKIPAEDYPTQRAALLEKGADVLRRLDVVAPRDSAETKADAESRLERAAAERQAMAPAGPTTTDDDLESLIAARRKERKGRAAGFCPRCGQPVLVSDRFCPSCGKSLV